MAKLRIPETYRPGLALLKSLAAQDLDTLANALAEVPATVETREKVVEVVAPRLPSLSTADLRTLIGTLCSLAQARWQVGVDLPEFVGNVVDAMNESELESLAVAGEEGAAFRTRLGELLGLDLLSAPAKAYSLQRETEHIYCHARILTDLRPVFEDPSAAPRGAIVTHALKIVYHEAGTTKELFLALDGDDLVKLRGVIDRAESKERSLVSMLRDKGVRNLVLS